jgi:hypothetical protein
MRSHILRFYIMLKCLIEMKCVRNIVGLELFSTISSKNLFQTFEKNLFEV